MGHKASLSKLRVLAGALLATALVTTPASIAGAFSGGGGVLSHPHAPETSGSSGWSLRAQGVSFSDMTCGDSSHCWAVGSDASGDGVVIATSDGGATWARQALPSGTTSLLTLSCPDAQHCWAISDAKASTLGAVAGLARSWTSSHRHALTSRLSSGSAQIIATSDGGTTWTSEAFPTGIDLVDAISCPSPQLCEAIGIAGLSSPSGPGGAILSTSDAGATWSEVTDPDPSAILLGISCPDVTTCIAVGASASKASSNPTSTPVALAMASNGTWSDLSLGGVATSLNNFVLAGVDCPDATHCWTGALGVTGNPGASMVSTADGGASWSVQSLPTSSSNLTAISCPSTSGCWVAVDNDLYISSGSSWLAQTVGAPGTTVSAMYCSSASACLILDQDSNGLPIAMSTSDGGSTWSSSPTISSLPDLQSISCPSDTTCFAVGDDGLTDGAGVAMTSSDGGSTWSIQSLPPATQGLVSISCPTATDCVAVGNSSLVATTDGGTTWTAESTPIGGNSFDAVACPDAMHCYATAEGFVSGSLGFGSGGLIMSTSDGGISWTEDVVPASTGSLSSVACPSISTCVASTGDLAAIGGPTSTNPFSGATGQVLYTSDGGSTWVMDKLPLGVDELGGVSCPTVTVCFAAAGSGGGLVNGDPVMLTSTDGGATWSVVGVPAAASELDSLTCPSTSECFGVTFGSLSSLVTIFSGSVSSSSTSVLATIDGGSSWVQQPLPGNGMFLSSLACADASHCWGLASNPLGTLSSSATNDLAIVATSDAGAGTTTPFPKQGYLMADSAGDVSSFGNAEFLGSAGDLTLSKPVVGMAVTPDGKGYWLVASDGGIFTFGDAGYYGSTGAVKLNKPIVGMAATPDGKGYWLVASDGGIFTLGDAGYYGSQGGSSAGAAVASMAVTPDGKGYWLASTDGAVGAYGDAGSFGAPPTKINGQVTAIVPTADGAGYWLVTDMGSVYSLGDATSQGDASGSLPLPFPVPAGAPGDYVTAAPWR